MKYLGCSFENELVFDKQIVEKLTRQMCSVLASPVRIVESPATTSSNIRSPNC